MVTTTPVEWLRANRILEIGEDASQSRLIQLADGRLLAVVTTLSALGPGSPPGSDVLGRFYTAGGQPEGDFFRLNTQSTALNELEAVVTALPGGRVHRRLHAAEHRRRAAPAGAGYRGGKL